ncbi:MULTISPECIES: hypothetical protein [unclassified Chelatococcus]|uniref:hypothetical protein n=1 Tax=unclassified Chelatococcus TaxID=2638111 RepID=UPI001BD168A7|nr:MULTISPECIES: hypothetical protein [unclassified Chelatococcus]MBS7697331.1 hypothetical protein [Chelatococcus sp. YT9]MBX3556372.1 hypothetical protein [Chelatococcus sp.]
MIALGMAYLVAAQMLLMGMMVGMQATAMPAGPATILCTPSGERPSSPPDRTHLPACCMPGCSMLGQGMAPPPALPATGSPPHAIDTSYAWVQDAPPHAHPRVTGRARAPPRQA